jgi:hypothetical protein
MIITSHMQTIIQIHPCLLKLSRKQESVTDGCYYYIPYRYCGGIKIKKLWVLYWVMFSINSAIFQPYHGENKLIFNEMMMRSALYYTNKLSWIFLFC